MSLVAEVHTCLEKFFQTNVSHEIPCSNRDSDAGLTLRELEAFPGFRTARLLTLYYSRVSRKQTVSPESLPHFLVASHDRPRYPELDRSGLTAESATSHAHGDGEGILQSRNDERSRRSFLVSQLREEIVQRSTVDRPFSTAGPEPNTGHSRLPTPNGLRYRLFRQTTSDASLRALRYSSICVGD
jgi:hypothetical protein